MLRGIGLSIGGQRPARQPLNVSGLKIRFDAFDGSTLTGNTEGATVGTWLNNVYADAALQNFFGWGANTENTTNKPIVHTAVAGNGGIVRYDGTNDFSSMIYGSPFGSDLAHLIAVGKPNKLVNGTFVADTDWTKGSGWAIAAGKATATLADTALSQTVAPLTSGLTYRVWYALANVTAGSIVAACGTQEGTPQNAQGAFYEDIVANGTGFKLTGTGFSGDVDNIVCAPLDPYSALPWTAPLTVVFVFKPAATGVTAQRILGFVNGGDYYSPPGAATANGVGWACGIVNDDLLFSSNNVKDYTFADTVTTTAFHVVVFTFATTSWAVNAYRNGTQIGSEITHTDGPFEPPLVDVNGSYTLALIGANHEPADEFFGGDLAEVLIYDSVLSTADRQIVEGYLAWKWGIQASLDVAHPWLTLPP